MVKIGHIELGDFPLLLAPMEDVSDPPFRYVCKQQGVDVMYTEFISSEALIRHAAKSEHKLDIFEYEHPIGIQLFGNNVDSMREAAIIANAAQADFIDINYGCPVKKVARKGAGAALLQDIDKMVTMTDTVVKATKLPVTVKTRLGWDENSKNIPEIAERLQDVGIQALTIHGRTRAQMYKGHADWTLIRNIKQNNAIYIPIFGNGDVDSAQRACDWKQEFGVDGIMIGRAAIGNPWIFREIKHFHKTKTLHIQPTITERVETCRIHLIKSIEWKGEKVGILEMRRHYSKYFKAITDKKQYINQLLKSESFLELDDILNKLKEKTE